MKKQAKDLIFISRIKRDGSGVQSVDRDKILETEWYDLTPLSLYYGTYIASNMNVFVVRLKNDEMKKLINWIEFMLVIKLMI